MTKINDSCLFLSPTTSYIYDFQQVKRKNNSDNVVIVNHQFERSECAKFQVFSFIVAIKKKSFVSVKLRKLHFKSIKCTSHSKSEDIIFFIILSTY